MEGGRRQRERLKLIAIIWLNDSIITAFLIRVEYVVIANEVNARK